ncbi:MAG: cysteine-rich CWC family protein [Acidobacteria bacterium]|nr:cysteine-rich CWC family protein [Acidobacteriota bacterium]
MNLTKLDKLTCESCGKEFSCGAKVGKCWCFEVELKNEALAQLRENFKNCLCENCLENLAANYTKNDE